VIDVLKGGQERLGESLEESAVEGEKKTWISTLPNWTKRAASFQGRLGVCALRREEKLTI
jgi:hypothetical protein